MNTYPRKRYRSRHCAALRLTALLALGALAFAGCVNQRQQPEPVVPINPSPVPGTDLDPDNRQKVRLDENLKAYPVGRYVDQDDATLMHEAHVVYRKENSAAWNLAPHASTVVPLGPVLAVSDPPDKKTAGQPLTQAEHKALSQQQLVAALIEQNEALAFQIAELGKQISDLRRSAASPTPTAQPTNK
ncbi:MAG: hypothetical protein LBK99_15290 [Opitutaceae bacterium]|nr:hypothetical protein [Opitutaceae bacterium]